MASQYRDKIDLLNEFLTKFNSNKGSGSLGIEYHLNNKPITLFDFDFRYSFSEIEINQKENYDHIELFEDQIIDFNHNLTHDLKIASKTNELDKNYLQDYDPLELWTSFIENDLQQVFIDDWVAVLEYYSINNEEYKDVLKEFYKLKDECEQITEKQFLPEGKKNIQNFEEDIKTLNESIKDYNGLFQDIEDAEAEVREAESEVENLDPEDDEDEYNEAEEEVEQAKRKLDDVERELDDKNRDIGNEWKDIYSDFETIRYAREAAEEKVEEIMDNIDELRSRAIDILKEHYPDVFKLNSEQAIEFQNNHDDLKDFIGNLHINECIQDEIAINNKSFELNHLVIFKDDSMAFRNQQGELFFPRINKAKDIKLSHAVSPQTPKGDSFAFSPQEHSIQCLNSFLIDVVRHEFRKTPKYQQTFIDFVQEQCLANSNLDEILQSIDDVKKYQNVIKNKDFDVANANETERQDLFERFNDRLNDLIKNHQTEKMVHNFFSQKYKHLITDETYQHFHLLVENNVDKETIQEQLVNKLAAYNTSDEFNTSLRRLTHSLLDWGPESIERNMKDTKSDLIYKDDDKMIICVNDFDSCQKLGTSNWCISRTKNFFQTYRAKGDQYIIYDFAKEPKDPESMIGITLNLEKGLQNAHLKNDRATTAKEQAENIALIGFEIIDKQDKPMNKDIIEKSIQTMAEDPEYLKDFLEKHSATISSKLSLYEPLFNALDEYCPNISLEHIISQNDVSSTNKKRTVNRP